MHKRHQLSSADTSSYYYNSWPRLDYAIQPTPQTTLSVQKLITRSLNLPTKKSAILFGGIIDSHLMSVIIRTEAAGLTISCCHLLNHAPPEVLLRQGAESGWVPQPDCLETPSTTVLEGMVGSHIKKLSAGASPGLNGIPIPFHKHACLPIERGRRVDFVNMLVPLIARIKVFLSKAMIPACWKVAKLSPLRRKGAMSNPGNGRMIAVSGVMCRIYANVLKDL
eukprot:1145229-Pelagomonas_calceolata.AAC.1